MAISPSQTIPGAYTVQFPDGSTAEMDEAQALSMGMPFVEAEAQVAPSDPLALAPPIDLGVTAAPIAGEELLGAPQFSAPIANLGGVPNMSVPEEGLDMSTGQSVPMAGEAYAEGEGAPQPPAEPQAPVQQAAQRGSLQDNATEALQDILPLYLNQFLGGGSGGGPSRATIEQWRRLQLEMPELAKQIDDRVRTQAEGLVNQGELEAVANLDAANLYDQALQRDIEQAAEDEIAQEEESRVIDEQMARLSQQVDQLASTQIDPNRVFSAGGFGQFAANVAVAAGHFAQTITNGLAPGTNAPNAALATVDRAVERDIQAQLSQLQARGMGINARSNLVGQMRDRFNDARAAENASRAVLWHRAAMQVQASGLRNAAPQAQQAAALLANEFLLRYDQARQQALAAEMAALRRRMAGGRRRSQIPTEAMNLLRNLAGQGEGAQRQVGSQLSPGTNYGGWEILPGAAGENYRQYLNALPEQAAARALERNESAGFLLQRLNRGADELRRLSEMARSEGPIDVEHLRHRAEGVREALYATIAEAQTTGAITEGDVPRFNSFMPADIGSIRTLRSLGDEQGKLDAFRDFYNDAFESQARQRGIRYTAVNPPRAPGTIATTRNE